MSGCPISSRDLHATLAVKEALMCDQTSRRLGWVWADDVRGQFARALNLLRRLKFALKPAKNISGLEGIEPFALPAL
jgi:hypothetical protein